MKRNAQCALSEPSPLRLFLVGFGGVGKKMAEILLASMKPENGSSKALATLANLVSVVAISTGSRGSLFNPAGVDLRRALLEVKSKSGFRKSNSDIYASSVEACATAHLIIHVDYDVLIELSPLSIHDGLFSILGRSLCFFNLMPSLLSPPGEPAISYIRTSLLRGKHVVTANKGPIAHSYAELAQLASEKGTVSHFLTPIDTAVSFLTNLIGRLTFFLDVTQLQGVVFRYESSVMDGAPVFNMVVAFIVLLVSIYVFLLCCFFALFSKHFKNTAGSGVLARLCCRGGQRHRQFNFQLCTQRNGKGGANGRCGQDGPGKGVLVLFPFLGPHKLSSRLL